MTHDKLIEELRTRASRLRTLAEMRQNDERTAETAEATAEALDELAKFIALNQQTIRDCMEKLENEHFDRSGNLLGEWDSKALAEAHEQLMALID